MPLPIFFLQAPPARVAPAPVPRRHERPLAPGVSLTQEVIPDGHGDGPQLIHVLSIGPEARVEAALGQGRVWGDDPTAGREIVSAAVERTGALAGINAGFFPFLGNPIGLHVGSGELVTEPTLERSSFLLTEKGARVLAFRWKGSVEGVGPLHGLNRKPGKGNELLLFTPRFFPKTLKTDARFEVTLSHTEKVRPGATITGIVKAVSEGGETPLEPGTLVLSAGGASADTLREKARVGEPLTIDLAMEAIGAPEFDPREILQAVTGAGRLLRGGMVEIPLEAERLKPEFSTTRHPRTAAGVRKDGTILLVAVDGRQAGLSRGMSLPELAALMLRLGCDEAVNLDGGGSTAIAVRGSGALNSPSDGKERPVADFLLVRPKSAATSAVGGSSVLVGPLYPLKVGETFSFLSQPDGSSPSTLWSVTGNIGFIEQNGRFVARRPGKGEVRFGELRVPIKVLPEAKQ